MFYNLRKQSPYMKLHFPISFDISFSSCTIGYVKGDKIMKKIKVSPILIGFLLMGSIAFLGTLNNGRKHHLLANKEVVLLKTIDFEELPSGNMSPSHHNSYYDGLIVADGRITETLKTRIDGKSLGMRMPLNSTTDPRRAIIQVSGYTKIVLDLKQERTFTKIETGCNQSFVSSNNGGILRDVEIPTYDYHEIILTFFTETLSTTTLDCGIDNIRFYGLGEGGEVSSEVTPSEPSPSESSSTEEIYDFITMRNIASYLENKAEHYPLSDEYVKKYQQVSGGYIDLAKSLGMVVDKSIAEPNQKWHFFDSWMYPSIAEGTLSWTDEARNRVYTRLLSPELLLWIYEACEVPTEKIIAAKNAAETGKDAGTHSATIAKNMRDAVPWVDLEISIQNFLNNQ